MKFVQDSFEFIPQEKTGKSLEGAFKMIELAARTCYKTEDLIKEGSAEKIINNVLIPRGHTSPLEFGTIYLYDIYHRFDKPHWIERYKNDRYSRVKIVEGKIYNEAFITTTYRTILQGDYENVIDAINNKFDKPWLDDLKYMCDPKPEHYKRYCYRFVMDRVGSQSVERHRGLWGISYAQESTRYINHNRDKFENQITCVLPSKFYQLIDEWSKSIDSLTGESFEFIKDLNIDGQLNFLRCYDRGWVAYEESLENDEKNYMYLTGEQGWKPEDARGVLPLDVKTEFLMCAYQEAWEVFLFRRTDSHAHPHIQRIAKEFTKDFETRI